MFTLSGIKRRVLKLLSWLCMLTVCVSLPSTAEEKKIALPELPLTQSQVLRLRLQSGIMGFSVPFLVYLPNGYDDGKSYPVWYALHGHSSSETMWVDNEHIDQLADQMIATGELSPLVMVFPFVRYDSAKVIAEDMEDGIRSESQSARFICDELVPCIDANFQTNPTPEARSIGGFSMGGLFALEIGLHHPALFSRVGAFSPALALKEYTLSALSDWLFPGSIVPSQTDWLSVHHLLATKFYLDCGGTSDPFSQGTESLARLLQQLGAEVAFAPHNGGHSLQEENLTAYLAFSCGF